MLGKKIAEGSSRITEKGHPYRSMLHKQLIARGKGPATFPVLGKNGNFSLRFQDLKSPAAVLQQVIAEFLKQRGSNKTT